MQKLLTERGGSPEHINRARTSSKKNGRTPFVPNLPTNEPNPIYLVVKFDDGDVQKMGEIYERMYNMLGEIKDIMASGIYAE
ncbi:hypothetical protein ACE6H2_019909 [Prunus campanulata]